MNSGPSPAFLAATSASAALSFLAVAYLTFSMRACLGDNNILPLLLPDTVRVQEEKME